MKFLALSFILLYTCLAVAAETEATPNLLLAKTYQNHINLKDYWVSEKLDGVRAYWNGQYLISRKGNIFIAPNWFTKVLPNTQLDGELWMRRNKFSELSGRVRRKVIDNENWKDIKFMIFDLPNSPHKFDERLKRLSKLVIKINAKHIRLVKQYKVKNHKELQKNLDEIVKNGAEGLMLHNKNSFYKAGRHNDLLKVKKYSDAEAIVIKHLPGKGKFKNMLGAILVETINKKRFKIGSGFTNKQRINPPKIGSLITYKYYGLTKNGIPRFASFMRERLLQ